MSRAAVSRRHSSCTPIRRSRLVSSFVLMLTLRTMRQFKNPRGRSTSTRGQEDERRTLALSVVRIWLLVFTDTRGGGAFLEASHYDHDDSVVRYVEDLRSNRGYLSCMSRGDAYDAA